MNKPLMILTLLVMLAPVPAQAQGDWRQLAIDAGRSTAKDSLGRTEFDIYRLGWRRDFRRDLLEGDRLAVAGYFEASVNHWNGRGEDAWALAFSPVFTLYWKSSGQRQRPYLELGVGAALISDTEFAGRQFSTHFQFEDRFGIGLRWSRFDLHYRFMHYSNGGIEKPNNGFDAHVAGLVVRF